MRDDKKLWKPLAISEVARLFERASFPWWIAGGHAIEQFVDRCVRVHEEIDILVLRPDATALRALLQDWDVWLCEPRGQLRPWKLNNTSLTRT